MYDAVENVLWASHLDNPREIKIWFVILLQATSEGRRRPRASGPISDATC